MKLSRPDFEEISGAAYLSYRYGYLGREIPGDVVWEITLWQIVEFTGWSIEYIEDLPYEKIQGMLGFLDGRERAYEAERGR